MVALGTGLGFGLLQAALSLLALADVLHLDDVVAGSSVGFAHQ